MQIAFKPKTPDSHSFEGKVWVDATNAKILTASVRLSKPPMLVDWVHFTAEFGPTPAGPRAQPHHLRGVGRAAVRAQALPRAREHERMAPGSLRGTVRARSPASWALAACVVAVTLSCAKPAADGVTDLDGHPVDPLAGPAPVTVLVFVATDCPISNRYVPELGRLRARFEPAGVAFWLVYPTAEESPAAIVKHLREFGMTRRRSAIRSTPWSSAPRWV